VRQAEGSIAVQSTTGIGTTFRVLLPAVEGALTADVAAAAPVAHGGGETVLVAEDERVIRDLVQRALARRGYQVLTAGDGQEAVAVAQAHVGRIDLLVSDVVMPHIGGPELARTLRRSDPNLRVILMSGYSADALREGQDVPGSDFVAKPFTPDELVRRVRSMLDRTPSSTPSNPG
jgi:two-component system, cell cycle sensor histidine kinase and response regulator CckA